MQATAERTGVKTIVAVGLSAALAWSKRLALALPVPKARRAPARLRGTCTTGVLRRERIVVVARLAHTEIGRIRRRQVRESVFQDRS